MHEVAGKIYEVDWRRVKVRLVTIKTFDASVAAIETEPHRARLVRGPEGQSYSDVGALLAAGGLDLAASSRETRRDVVEFQDEALLPPVVNPGAIFCIGLNYRTHIAEMGREIPAHPTVFAKLARSLAGPA